MQVFNERDDTFYECAGWGYGPLPPTVFAETSFRIKNREGGFTPLGSSTGVQGQFKNQDVCGTSGRACTLCMKPRGHVVSLERKWWVSRYHIPTYFLRNACKGSWIFLFFFLHTFHYSFDIRLHPIVREKCKHSNNWSRHYISVGFFTEWFLPPKCLDDTGKDQYTLGETRDTGKDQGHWERLDSLHKHCGLSRKIPQGCSCSHHLP